MVGHSCGYLVALVGPSDHAVQSEKMPRVVSKASSSKTGSKSSAGTKVRSKGLSKAGLKSYTGTNVSSRAKNRTHDDAWVPSNTPKKTGQFHPRTKALMHDAADHVVHGGSDGGFHAFTTRAGRPRAGSTVSLAGLASFEGKECPLRPVKKKLGMPSALGERAQKAGHKAEHFQAFVQELSGRAGSTTWCSEGHRRKTPGLRRLHMAGTFRREAGLEVGKQSFEGEGYAGAASALKQRPPKKQTKICWAVPEGVKACIQDDNKALGKDTDSSFIPEWSLGEAVAGVPSARRGEATLMPSKVPKTHDESVYKDTYAGQLMTRHIDLQLSSSRRELGMLETAGQTIFGYEAGEDAAAGNLRQELRDRAGGHPREERRKMKKEVWHGPQDSAGKVLHMEEPRSNPNYIPEWNGHAGTLSARSVAQELIPHQIPRKLDYKPDFLHEGKAPSERQLKPAKGKTPFGQEACKDLFFVAEPEPSSLTQPRPAPRRPAAVSETSRPRTSRAASESSLPKKYPAQKTPAPSEEFRPAPRTGRPPTSPPVSSAQYGYSTSSGSSRLATRLLGSAPRSPSAWSAAVSPQDAAGAGRRRDKRGGDRPFTLHHC